MSRLLELTGGTGRVRTMGAGEVRGREIVSERQICKPPERLCKQLCAQIKTNKREKKKRRNQNKADASRRS